MRLAHEGEVCVEIEAQDAIPLRCRQGFDAAARRKHPGVEDQHVHPAEGARGSFQGVSKLRLVGHVALEAEIIRALEKRLDGGIDVETGNGRAARKQRLDTGLADARGRAGYECDLAGEYWRSSAASKLRLLQIPVLDIENVSRRKRAPTAEQLRLLDDLQGMRIDVEDHRRVLGAAPGGADPERGIEDHPRRIVEHGLGLPRLRRMLVEVLAIRLCISRHIAPDHRHALGADRMVRRRRSLLRDRPDIGAVRKRKALGVVVYGEDYGETGGHGATRQPPAATVPLSLERRTPECPTLCVA